ncbi:MAG: hypothetical protein AAGA70_03090 [Pseudomonadota bacterium]
MNVLVDGTVMINGGSSSGNRKIGTQHKAAIWHPRATSITYPEEEMS